MESVLSEDLLGGFLRKYVTRGKLFEATFELTHRCNLRCVHCYIDQGITTDEVSIDQWKTAIDILVEGGLCVLTLTGGEPLLRKGLIEIVDHAFRKGCQTRIYSNATLFDSYSMVKEFKDSGLCYLETSIYGALPETHDKITGIPGSFGKTVRAVEWAVDLGIPVTAKASWLKSNWHEYFKILKFIKALGVYFRGSPNVMPRLGGDTQNIDFRMSFNELIRFFEMENSVIGELHGTKPVFNKKSTPLNLDKPPCGIARNTILVMTDGTLCPCNHLRIPVGNIFKDDFQDLWANSPELKKFREIKRHDFVNCDGCEYRVNCFFCMGDAWVENGDIFQPSKETCLLARARSIAEKKGLPVVVDYSCT